VGVSMPGKRGNKHGSDESTQRINPAKFGDMRTVVGIIFATLEYLVAVAIGLPPVVGAIAALQVGLLAATLAWLGGAPGGGYGLGRRW
jgi:hypothetical protein